MYLVDLYTVSANLAGIGGISHPLRLQPSGPADRPATASAAVRRRDAPAGRAHVPASDRLAHATADARPNDARPIERRCRDKNVPNLTRSSSAWKSTCSWPRETKLFCGCSTKFGAPPNTQTCPVCIGMPGTLPVMNREAFELALQDGRGAELRDRPRSPSGTASSTTIPTCPRAIRSASTICRVSHDG